jgi:starch phosphorylase
MGNGENFSVEYQAEMLISKIKHYLITTMGITIDHAKDEEFYRAFALTLREEIMINWTASKQTFKKKNVRTLHYLCMEYMPGRLLGNNITNIHAKDLVQIVLKKLGRKLENELRQETDPALGNGGLGRLAACFLDCLATQQYPAIGYGLRYQYGIFDQEIWGGIQVERPENWLLHENPWEFRRDDHAVSVYFAGRMIPTKNKKGEEVFDLVDYEEVRALSYDLPMVGYNESSDYTVLTLRLWTTKESPRNFLLQRFNAGHIGQAGENSALTDVLYPNDDNEVGKRIRLKQEFLLAGASIHDIIFHYLKRHQDLSNFADLVRIQINDTHPALVIAELTRLLLKEFDYSWGEAWETVKTCCSYTNHTILKESLEEWNQNRLNSLLPRQYHIIEKLNLELCNSVRAHYPGDEDRVRRMSIIEGGQVRMANLAIYACHKVNGVAALHTEILKTALFKDFYEMFPDRFVNVTNGVTPRRWMVYSNPKLAEMITKRIGCAWMTDFTHIRDLAKYANDSETQQEFLRIKKENKKALIQYIKEKNPIRDLHGTPIGFFDVLNEDALFDVQVKRFHEYKRQLMNLLHVLMIYQELKANPGARKVKRMVIFAGKAAPGYLLAKEIIQLIFCVARKINKDPATNALLKVAFIENYNVSKGEIIFPAADLSQQISTAGMEASGTSNMKLAMNGALTIGTEDGANIEMHQEVTDKWWPFSFGNTAQINAEMRIKGSYNPWDVYIHNNAIKQAVDALHDHSLAETEEEHQSFVTLYQSLLEKVNGMADRYFVLADLSSYYDTQKKVEALYENQALWAEYVLHNIAAMSKFSADESVKNYANLIWGLEKCPVDDKELTKVREDYSEHDKCRIFNPISVAG